MNTQTGQLISPLQYDSIFEEDKKRYIEVKRDLSKVEEYDMQIKLYSPCACGSGKKFKFCCKTN